MKKILFTIVFVMSAMCRMLLAQGHVYHNIGDTLRGRDTIYHYQWWDETWLQDNGPLTHGMIMGSDFDIFDAPIGKVLRYCYTQEPLNIIGIAAAYQAVRLFPDDPGWNTYMDSLNTVEYLLLYDACADSFPMKASLPINGTEPYRYITLTSNWVSWWTDCCDDLKLTYHTKRLYERYFTGKPVTVTDSFYVGGTTFGNFLPPATPENPHPEVDAVYVGYNAYLASAHRMPPACTEICGIDPQQQYKYFGVNDTAWSYLTSPAFMLVFPIVQLADTSFAYQDTTITPSFECPQVSNLRVFDITGNDIVLAWNTTGGQGKYQFCWGPQGTAPELCSLDSTNGYTPYALIENLDSCTNYVAYVRAVCLHDDSLYYSEWSSPLDIYFCDTTNHGISIPGVDILDQLTYVLPSPAQNSVQVLSGFEMDMVEVFDLHGRKMVSLAPHAISADIDVSQWPKGVYVVTIHCMAGGATKKLVVQ